MGDGNIIATCDEESKSPNGSFTVPGVSEFAPVQNANQSPPSWNKGFTKEDYSYMQRKSEPLYFNYNNTSHLFFR